MRSANWFSLIKVILKHGALTIPSHDYEKSRKAALEDVSDRFITTENSRKRDLSLAKPLLSLPVLGPLVAFISYYKTQLKWPTYIYHWPKKKLAYVRISKSACTSVQAALLEGRFPDADIGDFSVDQINYLGMNYLKPMLSPDYTCFTVVRDPAERLLSCYHDQYLSRKKKFYYFQDYLFAIIKPDLPIDQFLAIIHKIPDFLKDVHFRPQSAFLKNLSGVKIFKLEDDIDKLRAFLNSYDLSLSHLNRNPVEKLTIQDLSPSSKKLLKTIYRDDYKNFNYSTDF